MIPRPKPSKTRKPRRKEWFRNRSKVVPDDLGAKCPVSGLDLWEPVYGTKAFYQFVGVVDHLVCERLIRKLHRGRPHTLLNLLAVSKSAHSQKTAIEKHLEAGDLLRFRSECNRIGYPMIRVDAALRFYRLMR